MNVVGVKVFMLDNFPSPNILLATQFRCRDDIQNILQMTLSESSSFQCIACQPSACFGDLPAVEEHFSLAHRQANTLQFLLTPIHRVPHLLSSPATRAVALPSNLFCDRNSCPLPHHCCLCKATSKTYLGIELEKHMKTVHGEFFQDRLHHFNTSHCRSV